MVGQERKIADKVDGCRGQRHDHGGTGKKDGRTEKTKNHR